MVVKYKEGRAWSNVHLTPEMKTALYLDMAERGDIKDKKILSEAEALKYFRDSEKVETIKTKTQGIFRTLLWRPLTWLFSTLFGFFLISYFALSFTAPSEVSTAYLSGAVIGAFLLYIKYMDEINDARKSERRSKVAS